MAKNEIGLALGSGAVRGYAIFPIVKKLEKEGIKIIGISGSSIGALIGSYYALRGEIDSFLRTAKDLKSADYLKLVDLNNPKKSLIKGKKIEKFLVEQYLGHYTFADTKIPLYVCATDPIQKKSVYIKRGKLIKAVMASISIPGIFPPYQIGQKVYIDGGVLDPVPTKPLFDAGIKKVVGINLTSYKKSKKKKHDGSFLTALMDSFYMMMEQLAKDANSRQLFMLNPRFEPDPARMLSFYEWKENYEIGKSFIQRKFKDLRTWLAD